MWRRGLGQRSRFPCGEQSTQQSTSGRGSDQLSPSDDCTTTDDCHLDGRPIKDGRTDGDLPTVVPYLGTHHLGVGPADHCRSLSTRPLATHSSVPAERGAERTRIIHSRQVGLAQ